MQTGNHLVIKACAEVGPLGNWKTTEVVVGNNVSVSCHRQGIADIAVLEAVPFGLVGADGPIETWIEVTIGGTLCLEEVVEPRSGRKVSPSAEVARTEVTLDGRALSSVGAGVDRSPLVVGALRIVVEELNLEETLCVVLVGYFNYFDMKTTISS